MTTLPEPERDRLQRLLGRAETRWLVERVRMRLMRGQPLTGQVSLPNPTPSQRRAVETLLGRPPGLGRSLTVSLEDLDALIRRSVHADGLAAAAVMLGGPITVRLEEAAATEAAWRRAMAPLTAVVDERPILQPWYERISTQGLVRRLCTTPEAAAPVVAAAARLLAVLPVSGTPLTQLAQIATGDAHGLDPGRPVATIALSAIRNTWWIDDDADVTPAQRRRALWDCVGAVSDQLSSTVLTLNLQAIGDGGLGRLLAAARTEGEPVVLTLRQLRRDDVRFEPSPVFVCENPSVVLAAADQLGRRCPPLVCVGGQPNAAALRLLDQLTTAGCALAYHGDFDWGGLRIANLLWARHPMYPWRFVANDYESTVDDGGRVLTGVATAAAWDRHLEGAMRRRGTRVEEEAVLASLIEDLSAAAHPAASTAGS